jgi:enoyl-CoA hydratase/carnithine racemase
VDYTTVLIDEPAPAVRRITLNRPEKRNALNETLRAEILLALQEADRDPEVNVMILRGAGKCFSAGYDLSGRPPDANGGEPPAMPLYTAAGDGQFQRMVTNGWMSIWDLAKPVIAQVHSYCLAGGSELATCCDLVYVAEDAQIGYPAVRFGTPDNQFHAWFVGMRKAMEMMITGDSISGVEAVQRGWANHAYRADELEAAVIDVARRVATMPPEIVQINKRTVHRAMEIMGLRAAVRSGTEMSILAKYQPAFQQFIEQAHSGLTKALTERDSPFGDYRTAEPHANQ